MILVLTFFASHSWIIYFYDVVSAPLCTRRTRDRFLDRVFWYCPTSVDKRSILFCTPYDPSFLPRARLCMEVVCLPGYSFFLV